METIKHKLYCLSGLGVDHRAFRNLHIEGVELVHIPWIEPLQNETLSAYAKRLFESAKLPENYHLIGVSFGGMITQEFEKIRKPQSLFLVSTISDASELPGLFKIGGRLKIHKIIPTGFLKHANALTYYFFGAKQKEDKALLKEILKDTDGKFLRWAMHAILNWKNDATSMGIRIHGDQDKVLPKQSSVDIYVGNAGHFMIVTRGTEISRKIHELLRMK